MCVYVYRGRGTVSGVEVGVVVGKRKKERERGRVAGADVEVEWRKLEKKTCLDVIVSTITPAKQIPQTP